MIPRTEYLLVDAVGNVITDAQLKKYHTAKEVADFNSWMHGQTCILVGEEIGIYAWDYERWLHQGRPRQQGNDWD